MKSDANESVVVEEVASGKPRLSLALILVIVLGVLLAGSLAAVVWQVRSASALKSEVLALKKQLKEKTAAHDELQAKVTQLVDENENFSEQLGLLKEHAAASSSGTSNSQSKVECPTDPGSTSGKGAQQEAVPGESAQSEPVLPKRTKKPKSDKPNCELVGKTKEEQEETLKRCVSLIDLPK